MLTPERAKELEDEFNTMIEEISKLHPQYPEYGYGFDQNGKLVETHSPTPNGIRRLE